MSRQGRKGLGEADEGRLLELLGSALPADREPGDERVAELRAAAERHREERLQEIGAPQASSRARRRSMGRRGFLLGGAAASVGAAMGIGVTAVLDEEGPPTEAIALSDVAPGVQAGAELINHTWGVELLLTVDGLAPGRTFDATYRTTDGRAVTAGSFVGIAGPYLCRMNGAVLREELEEIEIVDGDGAIVMRSRLA